ncbi:MAG: DUF3160 domain-containing protein, partial [Bacteroidetes bacterium]|nr:DUF3160 domain-containing protein [Bacteroidota bacterium]
MKTNHLAFLIPALIVLSCTGGDKSKTQATEQTSEKKEVSVHPPVITDEVINANINRNYNKEALFPIDLNQDISGLSVSELRILRNALYARHGYIFMKADLRGYFTANTKWYNSLMYARWEAADMMEQPWPEITLTPEELAFADKVKKMEDEKRKQNFVTKGKYNLPDTENIVNLFQYNNLNEDFMQKLDNNGFVIVPGDNIQLFHVYEKNDYTQTPNFITTDLFLQLYHMYFGYLLKSLEKEKFIPLVTELTDLMYNKAMVANKSAATDEMKDITAFTATYFAVPYYTITAEHKVLPADYEHLYEAEIEKVMTCRDDVSDFLGYKQVQFPYSLFKPRGHYTGSEEFEQYFKAMMWLQTVPFCLDDDEQLKRAVYIAWLLANSEEAEKKYYALFEPVTFIIGKPDNLSIKD